MWTEGTIRDGFQTTVNLSFSWSFSWFNNQYFHMGFLSEPSAEQFVLPLGSLVFSSV